MRTHPPAALCLLIIGAGGHARVLADSASAQGAWPHMAAWDRDPARHSGELLPGVPLLDTLTAQHWHAAGAALHIAIGDNAAREREAQAWGLQRLASVLHPRASVSPHSLIEPGCFVAALAVVAVGARLARGVIVNHGAVVDHEVEVGAFTHVAPHVTLGGAASIGARVLLGAGSVVLPGVRVGDGVTIGAGAVVCRDVQGPGTYVGVPARRSP